MVGDKFATYDQGWVGWFCQKAVEIKMVLTNPSLFLVMVSKLGCFVCEHMISLYFHCLANVSHQNAFNIGGTIVNSLSLLNYSKLLEDYCNIDMRFTTTRKWESDQRISAADIKKSPLMQFDLLQKSRQKMVSRKWRLTSFI